MNILKAILMAKYGYTRSEVNQIIDKASKITSIPNLYDIAIIELTRERERNCSDDDFNFLVMEMFQ